MLKVAAEFRQNIIDSGIVIDPVGLHHEFASGMHGRKMDFDAIPDGSDLFMEWVEAEAQNTRFIHGPISPGRLALLSVANGTNRLVGPLASSLGENVLALQTEKNSPTSAVLTAEAIEAIMANPLRLLVAKEDVGTTGGVAGSVVIDARMHGARHVEVDFSWKRRRVLEVMRRIRARHYAMIDDYETFPTYTPEQCREYGHCSESWELIPHQRPRDHDYLASLG